MRFLFLVFALAVFSQPQAQDWPSRPVKFILSQPPGTSPDIVARFLADRLSRLLGQSVVVENRPGGQNVIGAQAAAKSPADGYTYFFATTAAIVTNPLTFKALPYDPAKDFVPVAMIAKSPMVIAVNPAVAAKTLAELVALDKAQPGKLAAANEGAKTFSGMMNQMLNKTAGTGLLQVPCNGVSPAIQDTIAGRTQVVLISSAALLPFLKRGRPAPARGEREQARTRPGRRPYAVGNLSRVRICRLVRAPRAGRHASGRDPAREPWHGPGTRRPGNRAAPVRLRPGQRGRGHRRVGK